MFIFVDGSFLYQTEHEKKFTACSKFAMQDSYDIKLFLSATKDKSIVRRFANPEYIDHPQGSRMPGQMWKTEGFFEHVVWENHLDAHQWLINQTCYHEGVKVRPVVDAGYVDCLTLSHTFLCTPKREETS